MVSSRQKLSENFIREFQDKIDWYKISIHQKLSENFIPEFQDKINWSRLSMKRKFSEEFIEEFETKIDWYYFFAFKRHLSDEAQERIKIKAKEIFRKAYLNPIS